MSYQATKRHRGNLNEYYKVKEPTQSENATYCMVQTRRHSEKHKIMTIVKRLVFGGR